MFENNRTQEHDVVQEVVYKAVTEAQETQDEFIFTTIQPFCSEVIQRKIDKKELTQALLLWEAAKRGVRAYETNM